MVSLAILPFAHPSTCTIILQGGTKTHIHKNYDCNFWNQVFALELDTFFCLLKVVFPQISVGIYNDVPGTPMTTLIALIITLYMSL